MSAPAAAQESTIASLYKWADKNDGHFKRQVSSFRDFIGSEKFPAAANRYHLYVSHACPWAHRTMIVRALKGLEDIISVSVVDYLMTPEGWHFSSPEETPGSTLDTVNGAKYIKEVYYKAEPEYSARFTVPVLWDKVNQTIVNNESSEIIRMLNSHFNQWAKRPDLDFYPKELASEIDGVNSWVYDQINNGVYKCGFATKQAAYDANIDILFDGLDKVEELLEGKEWLVGGRLTEADIRLFTTIVRFDPVYHTHFKCNKKAISYDYPNILKWLRRVYQIPGVKETVHMDHIKGHYYLSHKQINTYSIIPRWNGPNLDEPKVPSSVIV